MDDLINSVTEDLKSLNCWDADGMSFECNHCLAPESSTRPLNRCGGCQLVTYCNKDCQQDDWSTHRRVCKEFPVVKGKNVYQHATGPWENHIYRLCERAAKLPDADRNIANRIFSRPKVCRTCKEPQPDRLTICKCTIFCYCSKVCARKDRNHKKQCSSLSTMTKTKPLDAMRHSYPASFWNFLEQLLKSGWKDFNEVDSAIMDIHIVTSTAYFDAQAWEFLFHKLPNLEVLELSFIIQGTVYDPSLNRFRFQLPSLGCKDCDSRDRVIQYSVYQKPYHMYFSSKAFLRPDFVVTYGIPLEKGNVNNEISYRNMTHFSGTVLVLMDSSKDMLTQAVQDVKAAQPTSVVLLSPERNRLRGFGSHLSKMEFNADAPNVKYFMTGLCRKGADEESSGSQFYGHVGTQCDYKETILHPGFLNEVMNRDLATYALSQEEIFH